ncbi:MAG: hypothetical protein CL907_05125 [Dehalococcoidia bacterium]|nr:hypothetical protein [Dehalococcoidia bacterium]MEC9451483.1 hypothetical protein [Chloroflexota bacterium]MQG04609.1 hypothetical protein [SAR202 cluster bacterium]|tara:strand:- start:286 stop:726 length:441 start_codon:yes stop_codon:yes gene_type:complete
MDKILVILDKIEVNNKLMADDIQPLIKVKGLEIFYASFVQIPLQYPIDTEDKYFKKDFEIAEQSLKSFESEMNIKKIPKSRKSGGLFKVRDVNYGIIEQTYLNSIDLVIVPKKIIQSNSNRFNDESYLSKIINSLNSSIMIWRGQE